MKHRKIITVTVATLLAAGLVGCAPEGLNTGPLREWPGLL